MGEVELLADDHEREGDGRQLGNEQVIVAAHGRVDGPQDAGGQRDDLLHPGDLLRHPVLVVQVDLVER